MSASSIRTVSQADEIPVVSRAIVDSKEIGGETIPGIDPFVAYEHVTRRQRNGEDLEYELTESGGLEIFYGPGYIDEDLTQKDWSFSIRVEVMDDIGDKLESKDSYVEVRYNPEVEDHNNGERIWRNIVDKLEDRTVRYHEDIKGELHD